MSFYIPLFERSSEGSNLGVQGHDDKYAQAADDTPHGWRHHVMRAAEIAEKEGHPIHDDLLELLDRHEGGEDPYSTRAAKESREFARSLKEGRRKPARLPKKYKNLKDWCDSLKG
jgi:hypothetical protein